MTRAQSNENNAENKAMAPIIGLLVAGGKSRRMGHDKTAITTEKGPLWRRTYELLSQCLPEVYVSIRPEQKLVDCPASIPLLPDKIKDTGPLAGILTAFEHKKDCAWLVVACDLPLLNLESLTSLIMQRDAQGLATAYRSNFDGLPEPLCAIYEAAARPILQQRLESDHACPRRFLMQASERVKLLDLPHPHALDNANTPEDLARIEHFQSAASSKQ